VICVSYCKNIFNEAKLYKRTFEMRHYSVIPTARISTKDNLSLQHVLRCRFHLLLDQKRIFKYEVWWVTSIFSIISLKVGKVDFRNHTALCVQPISTFKLIYRFSRKLIPTLPNYWWSTPAVISNFLQLMKKYGGRGNLWDGSTLYF
jgi:hypothetical protein